MGQVIHKDEDIVRINQCFQIDTLNTHASLGGGVLQNACKVVQGGGGLGLEYALKAMSLTSLVFP